MKLSGLLKGMAVGIAILLIAVGMLLTNIWRADNSERLVGATMEKNHTEMLKRLRSGANVNFLFMGTTSSLQVSIENDDALAAAILLNHGASVELLDEHFQRILYSQKFRQALAKERYFLAPY